MNYQIFGYTGIQGAPPFTPVLNHALALPLRVDPGTQNLCDANEVVLATFRMAAFGYDVTNVCNDYARLAASLFRAEEQNKRLVAALELAASLPGMAYESKPRP